MGLKAWGARGWPWHTLVLAVFAVPVAAAPTVSRMDDPDKQGILHYTVKCEGGGGTLVECLRDDGHCGYAHDQGLMWVAQLACERIEQNRAPPPPPESVPQ